jgi:hypothetical protein
VKSCEGKQPIVVHPLLIVHPLSHEWGIEIPDAAGVRGRMSPRPGVERRPKTKFYVAPGSILGDFKGPTTADFEFVKAIFAAVAVALNPHFNRFQQSF